METISWIAVEAEATGARAWGLARSGAVLAVWQGAKAALPDQIAFWSATPLPVICAGLAETHPRPLPCPPLPAALAPDVAGYRHLPGLHQAKRPVIASPGMAARLGGVLAAQPDWDGVICLPGVQTLWAHVSAGEVVSLCLTTGGALFRSANGGAMPLPDDAFDAALSECLSRPERLIQTLGAPLASLPAQAGAMIGAELAAARAWWLGQPVQVLGRDGWPALYARALAQQGVAAIEGDGDAALIAGLHRMLGR